MVINLTIVNAFVFHTLHLKITHSFAIKTRKTTKKMEHLKWGGGGGGVKSQNRKVLITYGNYARNTEADSQ